tara:strand:+ start:417 stop:626 length:210 start_codon:yes stop_codon:yes gene_type:complete
MANTPDILNDEDFIDVKTLCSKMSISRSLVYDLIKQGMPSHKIAGARRFLYSEVKNHFATPPEEVETTY